MSTATAKELIRVAREIRQHDDDQTLAVTESVVQVPARHYFDEERFDLELRQVFRRVPLMLAVTDEVREPGSFKTMTVAGVPVIIVRHPDGEVRAFVNSCSHRGAQVVTQETGTARRFTCPYHAWTYNLDGELVSIFNEQQFGAVDRTCNGLPKLPVTERAGLIWVCLDANSTLSFDTFLAGYDDLLEHFGFQDWHLFSARRLEGPNWKIAYDGYMDFYHLPILHRDTFGPDFSSQALYYAYGAHQRVVSPSNDFPDMDATGAANDPRLVTGVWTIFPHVSIASFDGGGRGALISQLFPGETPGTSYTVQNYVMEKPPATEEIAEQATGQFAFLGTVVRDEDYATGLRQQRALESGHRQTVMFGRNEGGGQRFHQLLGELLDVPDDQLESYFAALRQRQQTTTTCSTARQGHAAG